jgi:hypothetical protein
MRCPACGSRELSGPSNSDPYNLCADCGHSWPLPGLEDVYEVLMRPPADDPGPAAGAHDEGRDDG